MEQSQLFKRLLAITEDEISSFVKHDDDVSKSLFKLDLAARTRHIIHAVQLEDMWQQLNEETQTFDIHLAMRLSPMTLCSCLDFEEDMTLWSGVWFCPSTLRLRLTQNLHALVTI